MGSWGLLTNHARALLYIARCPDARLRDLAAEIDVTERTAFGIVGDLAAAGYVVKERAGRRNRYHIQEHLRLPDPISADLTVGAFIDLLIAGGDPPPARPD